MHSALKDLSEGIAGLFFPRHCHGCGSDIISKNQLICIRCQHRLPLTHFERYANNPVEKIFWGRIPLQAAASYLYFTKNYILQNLLHELKYRGNREMGIFLGKQMGAAFNNAPQFLQAQALVALPLFPSKEKKRGYNQAALICEGFSAATGIPFLPHAITRTVYTETQTHKNRIERWQNMRGKFEVSDKGALENKKIILIDDVVTTGATLEACGMELLKINGLQLCIATVAYTSG